jgi:hypothetical protein
MKRIISIKLALIMLFAFSVSGNSQTGSVSKSPKMTEEERAKVIKMLLDSQKEYLEAIEKVTEAQWNYRPSPFAWSVGLTAEHIMLTEARLFGAVEQALAQPMNPEWEKKTEGKAEFIERVMPNRAGKAQAPIEVRPTGKLTREEIISRYKEQRARVLEFARKTDLPLKAHTVEHPFRVFNTLSAYDWLIYVPLHNVRHNKQMAEVKASPGYPK